MGYYRVRDGAAFRAAPCEKETYAPDNNRLPRCIKCQGGLVETDTLKDGERVSKVAVCSELPRSLVHSLAWLLAWLPRLNVARPAPSWLGQHIAALLVITCPSRRCRAEVPAGSFIDSGLVKTCPKVRRRAAVSAA
jgi:hypothetical protein